MKYQRGDKVLVDNTEGTIIKHYEGDMYEIRLWDKFRHIGDIVADKSNFKLIKRSSNKWKL